MKTKYLELMDAIHQGNTRYAKNLIPLVSKEHSINDKNNFGDTPVMHTAANGRAEIVNELLEHEANLFEANNFGNNALMIAIKKGNKITANILLYQTKINLNHTNRNGETAIIIAAKNKNIITLKALYEKGADINLTDSSGNSALGYAARTRNTEMVEFLLDCQKIDLSDKGSDINHVFTEAVNGGDLAIIDLIFNNGMTDKNKCIKCPEALYRYINVQGEYHTINILKGGIAPLTSAIHAERSALLDVLINKYELDVNAKDSFGTTALLCASAFKNDSYCKAMETLLQVDGIELDCVAHKFFTPLILVSINGSIEQATQLVEKGADVNKANECGGTPLMYAAYYNSQEVLKYLLENGADASLTDEDGKTVMDYAEGKHEDIIKILKDFESGNVASEEGEKDKIDDSLSSNDEESVDAPVPTTCPRIMLDKSCREEEEAKLSGVAMDDAGDVS